MDQASLMAALAAVLTFVAVGGAGWAIAGGQDGSTTATKRAQAVLGRGSRAVEIERAHRAKQANSADNRRKQILRTLKEQEKQSRKAMSLDARLRQAGLPAKLQHFWIASGVIGVLAGVITFLVKPNPLIALGIALVAGLGLPRWVVGTLAKRRMKKFTETFSDAIDVIVRGIKSGLPVHDCLKIIGRESPEPLGSEFIRLTENIGMGMTVDQSLEQMYQRMPTPELRFFTIVMAIQAKTGGNLAEALGNLSQVLRSRKLMREKIKALSSEAVASSMIIGALPPGVVLLITVTSPSYMSIMFNDPRGQMLMLGGSVWMAIGIFVMRKMINFKF